MLIKLIDNPNEMIAYSDPNRSLIPGTFQGSCRVFMLPDVLFLDLAIRLLPVTSFGSVVTSVPDAFFSLFRRVFLCRTRSSISFSLCFSSSVTYLIPLWWCWVLYHWTKSWTYIWASPTLRSPFRGHWGQYFSVLNSDSEYGLSLLTRGLLWDVTMPRSYSFACIMKLFIGLPLSACRTNWRLSHFSRQTERCSSSDACWHDSRSWVSAPTTLRLNDRVE